MSLFSFVALIPAALMCIYIYLKDHKEKESPLLLTALFIAGGILFFATHFAQDGLFILTDKIFAPYYKPTMPGNFTFVSPFYKGLYTFSTNFIAVALLEEACKWAGLFFITRKNKNFNCLFDGIVYATFISFGFGAFENIYYAAQTGWDTIILRTAATLPAHLLYGVIMGFFYTMWNSYRIAKVTEKKLAERKTISVTKPFDSAIWLAISLVLPVIFNGIYETTVMGNGQKSFIYIPIILGVYAFCFMTIRRLSSKDNESDIFAINMLTKKYPQLIGTENDLNNLIDTEVDPR